MKWAKIGSHLDPILLLATRGGADGAYPRLRLLVEDVPFTGVFDLLAGPA
jgi:hypothetical protein